VVYYKIQGLFRTKQINLFYTCILVPDSSFLNYKTDTPKEKLLAPKLSGKLLKKNVWLIGEGSF